MLVNFLEAIHNSVVLTGCCNSKTSFYYLEQDDNVTVKNIVRTYIVTVDISFQH